MELLFQQLKSLLSKYESHFEIVHDKADYYYVNTKKLDEKGKAIFFAMIKTSKSKVAFHLMPIYCEPKLIESISPKLKKKMQGKSCFNFTQTDQELQQELGLLVDSGFESFKSSQKI